MGGRYFKAQRVQSANVFGEVCDRSDEPKKGQDNNSKHKANYYTAARQRGVANGIQQIPIHFAVGNKYKAIDGHLQLWLRGSVQSCLSGEANKKWFPTCVHPYLLYAVYGKAEVKQGNRHYCFG